MRDIVNSKLDIRISDNHYPARGRKLKHFVIAFGILLVRDFR